MQVNIENLKDLVTGHELNIYQKGDALNELNKLIEHTEKLEKISIIDGVSALLQFAEYFNEKYEFHDSTSSGNTYIEKHRYSKPLTTVEIFEKWFKVLQLD